MYKASLAQKKRGIVFKFFVVLSCLGFGFAVFVKIQKLQTLKQKIKTYENKMLSLDEKMKLLHEDIEAVKDPLWLELALMQELGVIPEGAIKLNYLEEP